MSKKWRKRKRVEAAAPDPFRISGEPAALEITADAAAGDGNAGPRKFAMTAYTGVPMRLEGYYTPVVVDLESASAPRQTVPVPRGHDPDRLLGHTTSISISPQGVRATGVLSGMPQHTEEVTATAKAGFPWQASIGASPAKMRYVEKGEKTTVNGRSWDGPLLVAEGAVIREISLVPMGADGNTAATLAARHRERGEDMNFEAWLQARGLTSGLSDQELKVLKAAYEAEKAKAKAAEPAPTAIPPVQPPAPIPVDLVAEQRKLLAAEAKRVKAIHGICSGHPGLTVEVDGQNVDLEAHAIEQGWTDQQTELYALRHDRARPTPHWYAPATAALTERVVEAAVLQAGHYPMTADDEKVYTDQVQQAAHDAFKSRIGLQQVLTAAARMGGRYHGPEVLRDSADIAGLLSAAFRPEIRAEGFSTAAIANILANVQNKFMAQGYGYVEQSWRQIAGIRPVKDFKPTKAVNLLGDAMFTQLGPDGELKSMKLTDEAFANQASTYGRIAGITRADIINDDMAVLTTVPLKLGRGAGLKLNDVFWGTLLANANSFFAAGNNNYFSGASTNLQSSSLQTGLQKFRDQTDPDGYPIGVEPAVLVTPTSLEVAALELLKGVNLVYGGASAAKQPNVNIWAGRFRLAVSAYLGNSKYTNYSQTGWYLFADPLDITVIEVCFLNGVEMPTVQTVQTDPDALGIFMRGFMDFGVALQNPRGAVMSKGAA